MKSRRTLFALATCLVLVFSLSTLASAAKKKSTYYSACTQSAGCNEYSYLDKTSTRIQVFKVARYCIRQNGFVTQDLVNMTFNDYPGLKFTGKKKNKFKKTIPLGIYDESRDSTESFTAKVSGTLSKGKKISGKFSIASPPANCLNMASGTFNLTYRK